jgi:hypothetical protein
MTTATDILNFLENETGHDDLTLDTDLYLRGVYGDDFWELIEAYSKKFEVDCSTFLWYFHSREEGRNSGAFFFKSPDQCVERIPVTPQMLLDFVKTKKWGVVYPPHEIPTKRWDLIINRTIFIAIILIILFFKFFIK